MCKVQYLDAVDAKDAVVLVPVDAWDGALELGICHLVVALQRVATLYAAQVLGCDACLDAKYSLHLLLCLVSCKAVEFEHVHHVLLELRTDVECDLVVVAVVLLLGE